jgi:hypothetical protein
MGGAEPLERAAELEQLSGQLDISNENRDPRRVVRGEVHLFTKWDRRTTRMSETSAYSYDLCGHDPTEDLYWLRQRGRPVIRRSTQISS